MKSISESSEIRSVLHYCWFINLEKKLPIHIFKKHCMNNYNHYLYSLNNSLLFPRKLKSISQHDCPNGKASLVRMWFRIRGLILSCIGKDLPGSHYAYCTHSTDHEFSCFWSWTWKPAYSRNPTSASFPPRSSLSWEFPCCRNHCALLAKEATITNIKDVRIVLLPWSLSMIDLFRLREDFKEEEALDCKMRQRQNESFAYQIAGWLISRTWKQSVSTKR